MDITLAVLAAGMGSRYGGIKQLEHVGPAGEIIMDYSVHDALAAGFNKVVFIIRREMQDDFDEVIGRRLEEKFRALGVRWAYAYQQPEDMPVGRVKPWGTGHALLCCKPYLDGPFAVINADDYYGRHAFKRAYAFLSESSPDRPDKYGMIGFSLANTLSDAGGVTRGVCSVDASGNLTNIVETRNIVKTPDGPAVQSPDGALRPLGRDSVVSMNMWLLTPSFLACLEDGFAAFRAGLHDPLKDEYLLPDIIDRRLQAGKATVQVICTDEQWYGITYQADRAWVNQAFRRLVDEGVYPPDLYSDL